MAKPKVVDGGLLRSKDQKVFIGIDQSLTGFAVTAYAPLSGEYYSWVYSSPYKGVRRLFDLQVFLHNILIEVTDLGHSLSDIGMEASVYQSQSASVLGELAAAVKLTLGDGPWNVYPLKVPVTMVKKYATNKGTAKKNEVMLGIYKQWGVEFADDNMADSYVIARICSALAGKEKPLSYQKTVVELLKATPEKFRDS